MPCADKFDWSMDIKMQNTVRTIIGAGRQAIDQGYQVLAIRMGSGEGEQYVSNGLQGSTALI
jgi:hypothetical protein